MRTIPALACSLLLAGNVAWGTPRMDIPPPEPMTPEVKEVKRLQAVKEMNAWLPRVVGHFSYDGIADFNGETGTDPLKLKPAKGSGDCIPIGKGAGLHCVLHVVWGEEWSVDGQPVDGGVPFLAPASILYGIDAREAGVRVLKLDTDGLSEDGAAVLYGDTLKWTFETRCESNVMERCRRLVAVRVPPTGAPQTSVEIERWISAQGRWVRQASVMLFMRRTSQAVAAPSSTPPP